MPTSCRRARSTPRVDARLEHVERAADVDVERRPREVLAVEQPERREVEDAVGALERRAEGRRSAGCRRRARRPSTADLPARPRGSPACPARSCRRRRPRPLPPAAVPPSHASRSVPRRRRRRTSCPASSTGRDDSRSTRPGRAAARASRCTRRSSRAARASRRSSGVARPRAAPAPRSRARAAPSRGCRSGGSSDPTAARGAISSSELEPLSSTISSASRRMVVSTPLARL